MRPVGQGIGVLSVLFAALVWGTTGTAARLAPEVSPLAIGAAAMGLGGLLQALLAAPAIRADLTKLSGMRGLWLWGALGVAIYPLAFYSGMHLAGVTIGTLVMAGSAPLCAALIEWGASRRRPGARWWAAATLSTLGLIALTVARGEGAALGAAPGLGICLALLSGLTYAGYTFTARGMMLKGAAPRAAMGATFGLGGLLLLPVLVATGAPFLTSWGNFAIGAYMALVPMTLGYLAFGAGLSRVTASMATMLTLFEPVVAALLALLLLGERLSPLGWAGVAFVGAGLVLVSLPVGVARRRAAAGGERAAGSGVSVKEAR